MTNSDEGSNLATLTTTSQFGRWFFDAINSKKRYHDHIFMLDDNAKLDQAMTQHLQSVIIEIGDRLLYMQDRVNEVFVTGLEKKKLDSAYHQLWHFRTRLIDSYPSRADFEKREPHLFLGYQKESEQSVQTLLSSDEAFATHITIPKFLAKQTEQAIKFLQDAKELSEVERPVVKITKGGIGIAGDASRHYRIKGGRKNAVVEMFRIQPEGLTAKRWALLVEKPIASASQTVNSDVRDVNNRFQKRLKLNNDLIVTRNGYTLNFEELDIQLEE